MTGNEVSMERLDAAFVGRVVARSERLRGEIRLLRRLRAVPWIGGLVCRALERRRVALAEAVWALEDLGVLGELSAAERSDLQRALDYERRANRALWLEV